MTTLHRQQSLGAPYLLLFLFGIVLLAISFGAPANGLHFEAGIGQALYGSAGDNLWQDATYPHHDDLRGTGGALGVSGDFTDRIGWRSWLVSFGTVSNGAVWPNDPDYFAHDGAPACYQGIGTGYAYGLTLGPTLNFSPAEHWHLSLEAGGLLYRARWDESVRSLNGGAWVNASSFSKAGVTRTGETWYDGVMVRYKRAFLSYRRYADVHVPDSLFGNALAQTLVGVRFGF